MPRAVLTSSATIWQAVAAQLDAAAAALAAAGAVNGAAGLSSIFGSAAGAASATNLFATGWQGIGLAGLATGGFVSGPGTSQSDSIPAMLSNGEYVLNAAAVRKFGTHFLDDLNKGRVAHRKGGGLLGALSFLSPMLALATSGGSKKFNPLALISPLGFLGYKAFHESGGNPLALLSPLAFLFGKKLFGGGSNSHIPDAMLSALAPAAKLLAANNNQPVGDTNHINVTVPGGGSAVENRQTGLQYAGGIEAGIARKRRKGTI
jgi:hypothetical protein